MREKSYGVQGALNFKVVENTGWQVRFTKNWDIELQHLELETCEDAGGYDFILHLGGFKPDKAGCALLDDHIYIRSDYLFCEDSYRHIRWRMEVSGLEDRAMTVRLDSNLTGWQVVAELVINQLLWFRLLRKGYPLIHGSAVCLGDRGLVFAGRGGAGKSTVALDLLARGFRLLGDHFVIIRNGSAYGYHAPLHLTPFNLHPLIRDRLRRADYFSYSINRYLRKITGRTMVTKVKLNNLAGDFLADRAKIDRVFLLIPGNEFKVQEIDRETMAGHLVVNQKLETFPFFKYMLAYSYLYPRSGVASFWETYRDNLRMALDSRPGYKITVPPVYDAGTLDEIYRLAADDQ